MIWNILYVSCLILLVAFTVLDGIVWKINIVNNELSKKKKVWLYSVTGILGFVSFAFAIILLFLNPSEINILGWITIVGVPCLVGIAGFVTLVIISNARNKKREELENTTLENEEIQNKNENSTHPHTKGKMIKKYDFMQIWVLVISSVGIIGAIVGGITKNMSFVYSFGIVGILGVMYGLLMIKGRKKICPNCGDCVGKTIETKFMGTDVKTQTRQITQEEYRHEHWKTNVNITKNNDGTYNETTIQNIHHYEHTLQCEKCGHTWTVGESKKS